MSSFVKKQKNKKKKTQTRNKKFKQNKRIKCVVFGFWFGGCGKQNFYYIFFF